VCERVRPWRQCGRESIEASSATKISSPSRSIGLKRYFCRSSRVATRTSRFRDQALYGVFSYSQNELWSLLETEAHCTYLGDCLYGSRLLCPLRLFLPKEIGYSMTPQAGSKLLCGALDSIRNYCCLVVDQLRRFSCLLVSVVDW
jgi:hypothetical protein